MSKIAPALRLLKSGLNRTYEIAGFRNAIAFHDNLTAIIHGSETEGRAFRDVQARMAKGSSGGGTSSFVRLRRNTDQKGASRRWHWKVAPLRRMHGNVAPHGNRKSVCFRVRSWSSFAILLASLSFIRSSDRCR